MANRAVDRLYPEMAAGGFTRFDHQVGFFSRVNALATGTGTVVDLGAGRAAWADNPENYSYGLRHLRGRVRLH